MCLGGDRCLGLIGQGIVYRPKTKVHALRSNKGGLNVNVEAIRRVCAVGIVISLEQGLRRVLSLGVQPSPS